ncbi:MAG: TP0183 family DNA metabolism protein [Treponema sp.]
MDFKLKTITSAIISAILFSVSLASQAKVDFYGVVSADADKNMLSMTEDLYFAQLKDMQIDLSDMRSDAFSSGYIGSGEANFSQSASDTNAFYVVIKKLPDGKWECTANLKNLNAGKNYSKSKEYDSYYKILMESKTSVKELIAGLIRSSAAGTDREQDGAGGFQSSTASAEAEVSTQSIAGTWGGESFIDKIVILRGGRGFVIFKNGASMNISVAISGDSGNAQIKIKQTGGSNASYFPDIPRDAALKAATDAEPIEWKLRMTKGGAMTGVKKTLVLKEDSGVPEQAEVPVEWTRR